MRDELVKMARERDLLQQELRSRDVEICKAREELRNCAASFRVAETKIGSFEAQLKQKDGKIAFLEKNLEENRAKLADAETEVKRLEDELEYESDARQASDESISRMAVSDVTFFNPRL